jgi:RNA polymerase primary sigma factor
VDAPREQDRFRTFESEQTLVETAASGDRMAVVRMVELFLPRISGLARVYRGVAAVERSELMQEGVVGLMRALDRYDPSLATSFWAYASWWVRQAMQEVVSEISRPVVLSDRAERGLAQIREARRSHFQAFGREPSINELAFATGLPRLQVENLLMAERTPRGLAEASRATDDLSGTLEDQIADPDAEDGYEHVLERDEMNEVRHLADALEDRERGILSDHYGLGQPVRTLQQIGDRLGLSAERVRQIEEHALAKLRADLTLATDPRGSEFL